MVAGSKVEALEAKATKLKRDLIMDEANTTKEKTKTLANAADGAKGQTASGREPKDQVRGYQGCLGLLAD